MLKIVLYCFAIFRGDITLIINHLKENFKSELNQ